jgi:hypothetical protein
MQLISLVQQRDHGVLAKEMVLPDHGSIFSLNEYFLTLGKSVYFLLIIFLFCKIERKTVFHISLRCKGSVSLSSLLRDCCIFNNDCH